jgi:D-xylose transport system permease protein
VSAADPTLPALSPAGYLEGMRQRLRAGDVGGLPVILGLALIWLIFWYLNPNFLTGRNLTNLVLQITSMGTIAVGLVLVLLLGEIDLSVGAVSGLAASVMAIVNVQHGGAAVLAIGAAILVGIAIGLFQGFWFTFLRIPSFVVTLAGLLAWQGVLLLVLGPTGTVNVYDTTIVGLTNTFLAPWQGWLVAAAVIAVVVAGQYNRHRRRRSAGLPPGSLYERAGRIALAAVVVLIAAAVLNGERGVPLALLILVGFVVIFDFISRRTRFGRSIYAVGGNAEAARRAGISVTGVRVAVFGLAGALAACGGILATSRLLAVNQSSGGSDLLLDSIASAVIGGTSLFGGRGTVWAALAGALVIGSISNGMDLLALASSTKYIVTGGVLLAAVTLDAVARRGRQAAGRA